MQQITANSPAKINIFLKILTQRKDGYHNLQTIFVATTLSDELTFEPADGLTLTCEGNNAIPTGPENLIIRAAELLKKETGYKGGAKIHLQKKIPVGGGMGGGSSNAATTLKTLTGLWGLKVKPEKLMKLGLALGSDVPFFISGHGAAIGLGRGEILTKLPDFPEYTMVLVYPGISVSTSWAYQEATNLLTRPRQNVNLESLYKAFQNKKIALSGVLHNDFEEVVFSKYPAISEAKQNLMNNNAEGAIMTGSGSVVVGFFKKETGAREFIQKHTHLTTFIIQPLRGPQYTSA